LQTIKDALGNPTTYVYDIRGNVIQQVDALGHQTLMEYDDDNNLTKTTDPNGLVKTYTYDGQGNMLSKTESKPGGGTQTTRYTYNQFGQIDTLALPTGAGLDFEYDSRGNQLSLKTLSGEVITSSTYDLRGRVLTETDSFGTSRYEYDQFGNVIRSTDGLGKVTTSTYDANGKLKTLTDEEGTSIFTYDKLGRETKADYGNGLFVNYGYTGDGGDWTSLDAPTIGHIDRLFTDDGKLAGWVTADGSQLKYEYDAAGRLSRETTPNGVIEYKYDAVGRVIETLDPLTGAKTTRQYDAGGRVTQETNAAGLTTLYDFCSCGSPSAITQIVNGVERKTTYTYLDNNVTITDPLGRKTTTIIDENYMPIQTILPGGKSEKASYLFKNNLQEGKDYPTQLVDIGGNDRNFTYDSLGRLKTSTNLGSNTYSFNYGDDGLTQFISPTGEMRQYEYNVLGNLSKTIFEDGSFNTLSYNAENRLDRVTLASGSTLGYQYDTAGRLTSQTATVGGTTTFTYNSTGGFNTVSNATGTNTYSYDASGRVTNILNPNGSSIGYHYDLAGRVDKITEKANPTATERVTLYGYDVLGNQTFVKDAAGRITTMSYDAVNRLIEKTLPNGVKTVYSYNDLDQVSKIETKNGAGVVLSSLTYERTGIGEPTKITREDGSFVTYGYDDALRLTRESYFGTTGTLQSEISYTYDASGKRITKNNETYAYNSGYQLQSVTGANGAETYRASLKIGIDMARG
jgi:YD repeat-containing protein